MRTSSLHLFNAIFILSAFLSFLMFKNLIFYFAIIYHVFLYLLFLYKFYKNSVDLVDIGVIWLVTYTFFGLISFNISIIFSELQIFINQSINYSNYEIAYYNLIVLLTVVSYSYVLKFEICIPKFDFEKHEDFEINRMFGFFVSIYLVIVIFFQLYLLSQTRGTYIWFSDIPNKEKLFSYMAWLSLFLVSLLPFTYNTYIYYKKKSFFTLVLVVILLFALLRIRMYSVMFIFALLINIIMRGFRLNKKYLYYLFLISIFMLLLNLSRVGYTRNILSYYNFFSVFGEFILPNISSVYLITNRLDFHANFKFIDLVLQNLPSLIRPYALLYQFRDFYLRYGINVWPVGGILYIGQLYFYFGNISILVMYLLSFYLINVKKSLIKIRSKYYLITLPIFLLIFPRMEIWVLRSAIIGAIIFGVSEFLISIIRRWRKENNEN